MQTLSKRENVVLLHCSHTKKRHFTMLVVWNIFKIIIKGEQILLANQKEKEDKHFSFEFK